MQMLSTAIEFVNDEANTTATGDNYLIFAILCVLVLFAGLFFFRKKLNKFIIGGIGLFACFAICIGVLTFNQDIAQGIKYSDVVSPKLIAKVGNDVQIEDGYVKYSDDKSVLSFYGIAVQSTEDFFETKWKINYDGKQLDDQSTGAPIIFEKPFIVDRSKHDLKFRTNLSAEIAKKFIGKSPITIQYVVQSESWVSGTVKSKANAKIEGVKAQFIANDGWASQIATTDSEGNFSLLAPLESTGHIHFEGNVAAYDTPDFKVEEHMSIGDVTVNLVPKIVNHELLNFTDQQLTGVEFDSGVSLVEGQNVATDIGLYQCCLIPNEGYAWEDGSTEAKTFNWSIQGAYVKVIDHNLNFMFGTGFENGDYYVLRAENAESRDDIPWRKSGSMPYKGAIFDSSMKNYPISQTAWWFEGAGYIENFDTISNLNLALDPNKRGMESMFNGCMKITSLDLSTLNTANSRSFCWMFYQCYNLETLNLNNWNTSACTETYHMFDYCLKLTSLDLSSFDMSYVTDMSFMFGLNTEGVHPAQQSLLTSIKFGSLFNTSKVSNMSRMFYKCSSLASIDISGFNTSNVNTFESMFDGCSSLKGVRGNNDGVFDFANFNFNKASKVSWFVSGCSACTKVVFPEISFNNSCDLGGMVAWCSNLISVDCSKLDTINVCSFYQMFNQDTSLTKIYCKKDVVWNSSADSREMFNNAQKLVGGKGTVYDEHHIDGLYARDDKGTTAPGYFTGVDSVILNRLNNI